MLPQVPVPALSRHVKDCERKTAKKSYVCALGSYMCQLIMTLMLNFASGSLPGCLKLLYAEANSWYNVLCLSLKDNSK